MATLTNTSELSQELANLRHRVQFAQGGTFLHVHDASPSLLAHLLHAGLHLGGNGSGEGRLQIGTGRAPSHLILRCTDHASLMAVLHDSPPGATDDKTGEEACLDALYSAFRTRCTTGREDSGLKMACAAVIHRLTLQKRAWISAIQARQLIAESLPHASCVRLEFDRFETVRVVQELDLAGETNAALPFDFHWFEGRTLVDISDEFRRVLGAHVAQHEIHAGAVRFYAAEFHQQHQRFLVRFLLVPGGEELSGSQAWLAIRALSLQ